MPISYKQEVYRKLVHLSSLWMPAAMFFLPRTFCVILFGTLCVLDVAVEYAAFCKIPFITPIYRMLFGRMVRACEPGRFRLSGGPPMYASAFLTSLLFPKEIALCAFTTLILGDTAAALIGRRWGKHRFFNGKSLEGSAAFCLVGWSIILAVWQTLPLPNDEALCGFAGVCAACIAEFFNEEIHVDDNFSIPLLTGGTMCLFLLF